MGNKPCRGRLWDDMLLGILHIQVVVLSRRYRVGVESPDELDPKTLISSTHYYTPSSSNHYIVSTHRLTNVGRYYQK